MVRVYILIKIGAGEYFGVEKTIKEKITKCMESSKLIVFSDVSTLSQRLKQRNHTN